MKNKTKISLALVVGLFIVSLPAVAAEFSDKSGVGQINTDLSADNVRGLDIKGNINFHAPMYPGLVLGQNVQALDVRSNVTTGHLYLNNRYISAFDSFNNPDNNGFFLTTITGHNSYINTHRLGIGTINPEVKVDIVDNSPSLPYWSKNIFQVRNEFTSNAILSIDSRGYLGIGTSMPLDKLHIKSGNILFSDVMFPQIKLGNFVNHLVVTRQNDNTKEIYISNETIRSSAYYPNVHGFMLTSNEILPSYINSNNFGIGTNNPQADLHVSGKEGANTTIQIGGEDSIGGACLKIRDNDGQGWTYCSTLKGSLVCSINPCN